MYKFWLHVLKQIEESVTTIDFDDVDVFSIAYRLFPLLDDISYCMYGEDARRYLRELGFSGPESEIIIRGYRNGILHNQRAFTLQYEDRLIAANTMTSGGTGGIPPYNPGIIFPDRPEDSEPAEEIFRVISSDDTSTSVLLQLDRLVALVRYDIENKLQKNTPRSVFMIWRGEKIKENAPRL